MTMSLAHVCGVEFLAVGSPARLDVGKCRVAAALCINRALAVEGRAHPSGEVIVGFGSEAEVDAALARVRAEVAHKGGLWTVEYSPRRDEVRVEALVDVVARGRVNLAAGTGDPDGWYSVFIGAKADCAREATTLRQVRAGHRSQKGRTP